MNNTNPIEITKKIESIIEIKCLHMNTYSDNSVSGVIYCVDEPIIEYYSLDELERAFQVFKSGFKYGNNNLNKTD